MGVFIRKDSPFYQLLLERHGDKPLKQPTKILHTPTTKKQAIENRRLAHIAYNDAMTKLAKGDLGMVKTMGPALKEFWKKTYQPWIKKNYPSALAETTRVIEQLFLPTLRDLPLGAITPPRIHAWWDTRTSKPQSRFRELTHLRGLLTRAVTLQIITAHPLDGLDITAPPTKEIVRYLTDDEYTRLTKALSERDAAAIQKRVETNKHRGRKPQLPTITTYGDALHPVMLLSIHTGMRRGEVFKAHWSAVDWQAQTITVEWWTAKRNRKRSVKSRRIPLNATALAALKAWHQEHGEPRRGLIFPGKDGKPLTNLQTSFETVLEAAGIEDFRWHDMRHTFGSWLVQKGVSLYVVQKLMGHASIAMTMRYAHLAPDQGKDAVNLLTATIP